MEGKRRAAAQRVRLEGEQGSLDDGEVVSVIDNKVYWETTI